MRINHMAVVLWVFLALVGYLIAGSAGAAYGAVVGICLSFIAEIL